MQTKEELLEIEQRLLVEMGRLAALAAEAKRRGLSYGQLMAGTTEYERNQIVQKRRKT